MNETSLTDEQVKAVLDYRAAAKQESVQLIRLVRMHDLLYDNFADGYNDYIRKEYVWDTISKSLFPEFDTVDFGTRKIISLSVRKRWKSLRDLMARELKKLSTMEGVIRKRADTLFSEMEFLIPHIRTTYSEKINNDRDHLYVAEALAAAETFTSESYDSSEKAQHGETQGAIGAATVKEEYLDGSGAEVPLAYSIVDLTEDIDIKPEVKLELGAIETNSSDVPRFNWGNQFCTVAEYKGGQFTSSAVLCTDLDDSLEESLTFSTHEEETNATSKSIRNETPLQTEVSKKVITGVPEENNFYSDPEEDRMFLLSLVSDLKRISPEKRTFVKAEIARIIANGIS